MRKFRRKAVFMCLFAMAMMESNVTMRQTFKDVC